MVREGGEKEGKWGEGERGVGMRDVRDVREMGVDGGVRGNKGSFFFHFERQQILIGMEGLFFFFFFLNVYRKWNVGF